MPIEVLDLSSRTYNCLKRSQITTVGQLLQMSEDELLGLRNFGQKSLQELHEKLARHGIQTSGDSTGGGSYEDDEEEEEELDEDTDYARARSSYRDYGTEDDEDGAPGTRRR
jgi:DNA-directed RNA polymerase alpha subunit